MSRYIGEYAEQIEQDFGNYSHIALSILLKEEQIFVICNKDYDNTKNWDVKAQISGRFYLNTNDFFLCCNDFEEFDLSDLENLWKNYYAVDTEYGITAYICKKRNMMPLGSRLAAMRANGWDVDNWDFYDKN